MGPCMTRQTRSCYGPAMDDQTVRNPLAGVSDEEQRIMERLLRMHPEPHKDAPKPTGTRADAQRRRREREHTQPSDASERA
jgi:hypothetical protein